MKNRRNAFPKILITIVIVISLVVLVYGYNKKVENDNRVSDSDSGIGKVENEEGNNKNGISLDNKNNGDDIVEYNGDQDTTEVSQTTVNYINPDGMTLETRINVPAGFTRVNSNPDSFLGFTRSLELKEDGSPVLLHNGQKKRNQTAQAAVFTLDVGEKDLQQCADSVVRVYSEYYWSIGEYEKIRFHLTNGFLMDYENWRNGRRIQVDGNDVYWVDSTTYDDSYENFRNYLTNVMIYAGTLSLDNESTIIELENVKAGDMLLIGGSPGHCVLVIDVAQNESGESCYLLGQGYMPAQEFHVLKNPKGQDCPWYFEEDLSGDIETPEYGFDESHIKRWNEGFD